MNKKKRIALLLLLVLAVMGTWMVTSHHIIDFKFYKKDAASLDLRGQDISPAHYAAVREKLPQAEILWDVPLPEGKVPSDSREVALTDLAGGLEALSYFQDLETLDLRGCQDLTPVTALHQVYPHVKLIFETEIGGATVTQDSKQLTLAGFGDTELALLPSMEDLETVTVKPGAATDKLLALKAYCAEGDIDIQIELDGTTLTHADRELTVEAVTEEEADLLLLADGLETLHLTEPEAEAETLLKLRQELKDTQVTWEKNVMGLTFSQDAAEIDLTPAIALAEGEEMGTKTAYQYAIECDVMGDRPENPTTGRMRTNRPLPDKFEETEQLLQEAAEAMAYFPEAEILVMRGAWLNDDVMAEYREEHRADYKTVWSVRCADMVVSTDATFFMPTKYRVPWNSFTDLDAYNLKYCEDMECIDIGHLEVANLDFVVNMPKLKYLVVTLTNVNDLTPLTACQNLVFLEVALCPRTTDYTPLLECKSIRDLDISHVYGDITPVLEMDWLDHLWLGDYNEETYELAKEALPNVKVGYNGCKEYRWRGIPNYYAMRDALLMFYMN